MLHLTTRGQTKLGCQGHEHKGHRLFGDEWVVGAQSKVRVQKGWGRACRREAGGLGEAGGCCVLC